jgi:hypothetical protein
MKTELLGLPIIEGKKTHLQAFVLDCVDLGYEKSLSTWSSLDSMIKLNGNTDKHFHNINYWDGFKQIVPCSSTYSNNSFKKYTFNLPQDWQKALDFMKENMDRWNKIQEENKAPEFKVGDWVCIEEGQDSCIAKEKCIGQIVDHNMNRTAGCVGVAQYQISFNNVVWGINGKLRLATSKEIEQVQTTIFKMFSSTGDFELEVSPKGIYYRNEDCWLETAFLWEFTMDKLPYKKSDGCCFYRIDVTKVDVGCKKDTLVSQWQEVYNYYNSIKN